MVASTYGISSPSNQKVTLKAMDHENIMKPMKGIDWRAPSPLVKVMDTSKVTSPSPFHQQRKWVKYFFPNIEHYKVKNGCFHVWNPEPKQSESDFKGNGSWKYNQAHERKRLMSPLPARQSDGHIESDLSISISPTKEKNEVFFYLPWTSKGQEWLLPYVESRARAIGKYPWRQWIMKI